MSNPPGLSKKIFAASRGIPLAVAVATAYLLAAACGGPSVQNDTSSATLTAATPTAAPSANPVVSEGPASRTPVPSTAVANSPPPGATIGRVARVVDGDTIDVVIDGAQRRVRLILVDTPEVLEGAPQCFGPEASAYMQGLVGAGSTVYLEKDLSEVDRYDRLLRYVYREDGRMVNELLVQGGYAVVATLPPDVKYLDRLRAAEDRARDAQRGLWGACVDASAAVAGVTATPSPSPAPTAVAFTGDGERYVIGTGGVGVRSRTDCEDGAPRAFEGGVAEGARVEVALVGRGRCSEWSYVRAGGASTWVRDVHLGASPPVASAQALPAATPASTPTVPPTRVPTVVPIPVPTTAPPALVISAFCNSSSGSETFEECQAQGLLPLSAGAGTTVWTNVRDWTNAFYRLDGGAFIRGSDFPAAFRQLWPGSHSLQVAEEREGVLVLSNVRQFTIAAPVLTYEQEQCEKYRLAYRASGLPWHMKNWILGEIERWCR